MAWKGRTTARCGHGNEVCTMPMLMNVPCDTCKHNISVQFSPVGEFVSSQDVGNFQKAQMGQTFFYLKCFRYSPYPSFSRSARGMNRRAAEFMQ